MGSAFAENLIARGYQVRVWDRVHDRIAALVGLGAEAAATPEALVIGMDAVLVMLWDDAVAKEISLGRIIPAASPPTLVIEMSTLSPGLYQTLGQAAERKGLDFLACPVLGSVDLARAGKLTVLASGRRRRSGLREIFSEHSGVRSPTLVRPVRALTSNLRTTRSSASLPSRCASCLRFASVPGSMKTSPLIP